MDESTDDAHIIMYNYTVHIIMILLTFYIMYIDEKDSFLVVGMHAPRLSIIIVGFAVTGSEMEE